MTRHLVLGLTGASGALYAVRLCEVLLASGCHLHVAISPSGGSVLEQELGLRVDLNCPQLAQLVPRGAALGSTGSSEPLRPEASRDWPWAGFQSMEQALGPHRAAQPGTWQAYHYQNFFSPMASGSFLTDGMVVCPCSGSTLSAIACAGSHNLIQRAADVHLKERRPLILVPRETPLSTIQLENMRRCAEAGAVVLPAMPGFYQGARSIGDLVDFVVARVCDQLRVPHRLMKRWGDTPPPNTPPDDTPPTESPPAA